MIKRFLVKAGRKIKLLAGSGDKKKKPVSSSEQGHGVQKEPVSPEQQGEQRRGTSGEERNRSSQRPRKKKPRWTLEQFPVDPVEGKSRFHDFSLPLGLMHAVADLDFQYCTPIQEKALPDAMAGKDIIGRAGTGTGKSAVFLIAVFTRLLGENRERRQDGEKRPRRKPGCPRALIIAPTRELVMQIAKDGNALAKYSPLRIVAVYGGTDYQKQEQVELFHRKEKMAFVLLIGLGCLCFQTRRK